MKWIHQLHKGNLLFASKYKLIIIFFGCMHYTSNLVALDKNMLNFLIYKVIRITL